MTHFVAAPALNLPAVPVELAKRPFLAGATDPSMPVAISKPPTATFPLVLQPKSVLHVNDISVQDWAADATIWIDAMLHEHGAILLRGLPLVTADDFTHFVEGLDCETLGYAGGIALRDAVTPKVMTASYEPPEVSMEPHNEMAYTNVYPSKVLFFCETPTHVRW